MEVRLNSKVMPNVEICVGSEAMPAVLTGYRLSEVIYIVRIIWIGKREVQADLKISKSRSRGYRLAVKYGSSKHSQ